MTTLASTTAGARDGIVAPPSGRGLALGLQGVRFDLPGPSIPGHTRCARSHVTGTQRTPCLAPLA